MSHHTTHRGIAAVATCAAAVLAAVTVQGHATATATTHTRQVMVIGQENRTLGHNRFGGIDVVRSNGALIGYDTASGRYLPRKHLLVIDVAAAFRDGLMYLHVTQDAGGVVRGAVRGGTGAYRGATGTVTGQALSGRHDRTRVTLTWRT